MPRQAPRVAGVSNLPAALGGGDLHSTPAPQGTAQAWVGVAWCGSAVLLGAGTAWVLVAAFGVSAAWAAPVAAALGALAAALPLVAMAPPSRQASMAPVAEPMQISMSPTGVPRPVFMELAAREWARARRHGTGAALLVVQIDRFARLAQARGPQAAHAVLEAMLRQTAPTLRGADVLTMYTESEIAVFLAPADATGALDVAERIRERTEQLEVQLNGADPVTAPRLRVTVSVGVAHLRPAHLNLQALLDDAEDAVAAARQSGGNCVRAAPVDAAYSRPPDNWRDGHRAEPK
jgi:diguanylate cyclase